MNAKDYESYEEEEEEEDNDEVIQEEYKIWKKNSPLGICVFSHCQPF